METPMISYFILLIFAHLVCDFILQNNQTAVEKAPGKDVTLPWYYWMAAHSATHGLAVALVLGNAYFGLAEFVAHFLIDFLKVKGKYNLHVDQLLHVLCKITWLYCL